MDLFSRQWASYRAIVSHNLMEHCEVAEATAGAIEGWLASRSPSRPAPRMVDLGCGDLALLPTLLRRLPLAAYTGIDITAAVLPMAARALGPVPYPTDWREGELLAWAIGRPAADSMGTPQMTAPGNGPGAGPASPAMPEAEPPEVESSPEPPVDILHAAFSIHHHDDDQKSAFLAAARRRINPDGLFVWADVFREPGESRQSYVQRYSERIRACWEALDAEQQGHVIDHLSRFDIPADRESIRAVAEAAGWRWRWAWQGTHRAEALAVLTPA